MPDCRTPCGAWRVLFWIAPGCLGDQKAGVVWTRRPGSYSSASIVIISTWCVLIYLPVLCNPFLVVPSTLMCILAGTAGPSPCCLRVPGGRSWVTLAVLLVTAAVGRAFCPVPEVRRAVLRPSLTLGVVTFSGMFFITSWAPLVCVGEVLES